MDIDDGSSKSKKPVNRMLAIVPKRDRSVLGLRTGALTAEGIDDQIGVVSRLHRLSQKKRNQDARRGESDRRVLVDRPKHLFSGKRSNGTASHR
jgi:nucleolar GTP-binding protein